MHPIRLVLTRTVLAVALLFIATATVAMAEAAPIAPAAPGTPAVAETRGVTPEAGTRILPIGAARRLPLGTVVTVMGSATVPSGTFSSSFGDEGFAIQDSSGGIYVSTADNLGIKLQQRVQVTGTLTESSGLLTLVPAADGDVEVTGRGYRVRSQWERTGKVGPANQGLIIFVVGVVIGDVEPDPPFGSKFMISDGSGPVRVFINTSSGIDISTVQKGQLLSVTGFSSAFDTPEIDPRFQSDLRQPLP